MKILVVDDSRVMRQIVIRALRQAGYVGHTIVEAGDGIDALTKAHTEAPQLILSDWNTAGMSGLDVLEVLRSAGSTVPFGFITSECSPPMRARAAAAGAEFLVAKPFTAETLAEALDPLLGDRLRSCGA